MDGNHARVLLGVPPHATHDQIRRAFRAAAFVAHPDRGGSASAFRQLVGARDVLLAASAAPTHVSAFEDVLRQASEPRFSARDIPRAWRRTGNMLRADTRPPVNADFDGLLRQFLAA